MLLAMPEGISMTFNTSSERTAELTRDRLCSDDDLLVGSVCHDGPFMLWRGGDHGDEDKKKRSQQCVDGEDEQLGADLSLGEESF